MRQKKRANAASPRDQERSFAPWRKLIDVGCATALQSACRPPYAEYVRTQMTRGAAKL